MRLWPTYTVQQYYCDSLLSCELTEQIYKEIYNKYGCFKIQCITVSLLQMQVFSIMIHSANSYISSIKHFYQP